MDVTVEIIAGLVVVTTYDERGRLLSREVVAIAAEGQRAFLRAPTTSCPAVPEQSR
jgi:hypothetical protein